ncbi:MAG: hypothetical protein GF331_22600 [Chitinivibrionales bacterium]|nr:hypothetical protein [Chitinivibrionales bacterium]
MKKTTYRKLVECSAALLVLLSASAMAQYNQRVPFQTCELVADTAQCLEAAGDTIKVGASVATLGELFRVCMQADTTTKGGQPIRVVLAIDHSGSMCTWHSNGTIPPNDSTDRRIVAAHAFVDSLAARSPGSEVGIVRFRHSCSPSGVLDPLSIDDTASVRRIHQEISNAACLSDPYEYTPAKSLRPVDTYQGCAVYTSLQALEVGYDPNDTRTRHVILLTDDGWTVNNDSMPEAVISAYERDYPGREIPKVHAVFMSRQGSTTDPNLQYIADSTGGMFIPNATPDDIVDRFMEILNQIVVGRAENLYESRITDLATGEQLEAIISQLPGGPNDYLVRLADWPLDFGLNRLEISRIFKTVDNLVLDVESDTLLILRVADTLTPELGTLFSMSCRLDSTDIIVTCAPTRVEVGNPVAAEARVQSDRAEQFAPGVVTIRAITRFDPAASGTVALYRLDGSLTDAAGNADGSGTVGYASSGAAFGGCLSSGSFTADLYSSPQQVSACTFEAWIRPSLSAPAGTIVDGNGFSLTVDAVGRLVFLSSGVPVRSAVSIARNVWLHVAVTYASGRAQLFVNGVPISSRETVPAPSVGTVTIGPFGSGLLDEVRFSDVNRAASSGGITTVPLPVLDGVTWNMPAGSMTASSAPLPPEPWAESPRGRVGFTFTGAAPADVVVNLLHEDANALWSVNGNPVRIYSTSTTDAVPSAAYVYDTDGNGYVDQIVIRVPDSVSLATDLPPVSDIVNSISLTLYNDATVSLTASGITDITDSTFTITLNETSGAFTTGWRDAQIDLSPVPLTSDGRPLQVVDIYDRAGPVVERAVYRGGPDGNDTLIVTFSEPVVWSGLDGATPSDVFVYYDDGDPSTRAFDGLDETRLDSLGGGWRSRIVMDNGFAVTPLEDSLQLRYGMPHVRDSAGNEPPPDGNKAPIEWGGGNDIRTAVGPKNPFRPGKGTFPQEVMQFYGNLLPPGSGGEGGGVIVAIDSDKPLRETDTDPRTGEPVYGKGVVFDALGNVVMDDLLLKRAQGGGYGDYGVFWNGYTLRNRAAGGGTYLMIVRAEDLDGSSVVKRVKVGVLHNR